MPTDALLPRDAAILRYLARYRIGLRPVLGRLFFDGGDPGRVLGLLAKRGLVMIHSKSLPKNTSYVTLTAAGYVAIGMKLNKRACEAIGLAALTKAISMSVACTVGSHRRHRQMRTALLKAFGPSTPPDNIFHVASDECGWPVVFRVVFATSVDERQLERIKRHVDEARKNPAIFPWLISGDYGFLVLVPWLEKIEAMKTLLRNSQLAGEIIFAVDVGPTAETLQMLLKKDTTP